MMSKWAKVSEDNAEAAASEKRGADEAWGRQQAAAGNSNFAPMGDRAPGW